MSKHGGKCLRALGIGLVASLVALAFWQLGWLQSWEAPTWAWRARFFAARESPSPQVKMILLDQASLDWAEEENAWSWPWPREVYGAIASFCKRGGAKALAIDLLFTESSIYGVPDDEAMGQMLADGPPAVLALIPGGSETTWPDFAPRPDLDVNLPAVAESEHLLFPVKEIITGTTALGHVAGRPDADGVFRRFSPLCRFDGQYIPAMALATCLAGGADSNSVAASNRQLTIGETVVPLDEKGDTILRFRGENGWPEAFSAAAVVQSELRLMSEEEPVLSPDVFKDCYVFVGCSAPSLLDLRPVAVNAKCPGVALHATFVDNLLTDSFIADAGGPVVILVVTVTAILAALSLTYGGKWWQAGPLAVLWMGVPVVVGFVAYAKGLWWPVATHGVASGLGLIGALAANYWVEGRQKAFIKQAFRHYLSGDVIEKILRDPGHLQLGGEKRELTIMFTDLAGFSTFSERLGPVELTTLLNDYLSEMTDIIMEEGGTLDKYEGDAIIAFWNAPLEQPDHAVRACRAALRCQRRLAERREAYQQQFGAALHMRVGLNTGEVVVGNMGSRTRFNYTILGDAANLAARLEGANKAFGTEMMISENTWSQASSEFAGRKLANLRVVGRKTPVAVYEMSGYATDPLPTGWETFETALTRFGDGDFEGAAKLFKQVPDDPAAERYIQRCAQLAEEEPESWDGVWELTQK